MPPSKPGVARDDADLGHALEFLRLIWAVHHGLQSTSKRMAAELGVTGPQRLVVRLLGHLPGASAGELAKLLRVHPSTLTGVLHRLEKNGFVKRRPAAEDRRRAVLTLTSAGHKIDAVRAGTVEAAVRQVIESAAEADLEATERVLTALAQALGAGESEDDELGGGGA